MSGRIVLNEELTIETYPFSDFITCVEVKLNGDSYQSFCTSTTQIDEWKQDHELLADICYDHIRKFTGTVIPKKHISLSNGMEVDIYPFSEYIYCVDVYQNNQIINSFCCDAETFEEYEGDLEAIIGMYKKIS